MKYKMDKGSSKLDDLKGGCFKKKDHDENYKIFGQNSNKKFRKGDLLHSISKSYEKYIIKLRDKYKSKKRHKNKMLTKRKTRKSKKATKAIQIPAQSKTDPNKPFLNNQVLFADLTKKNKKTISFNSMRMQNANLLENQEYEVSIMKEHLLNNNLFHSHNDYTISNLNIPEGKSFEDSKFISDNNNKTLLSFSDNVRDLIIPLNSKKVLENYERELSNISSALNLRSDSSFKFDTILVDLKDFNFIVKNYSIHSGRTDSTLKEMRVEIIKGICNQYGVDPTEKIENSSFKGLRESTFIKDIKNLLMYIERKPMKLKDPTKVLLRIINVDGKLKNFLPFESKFIEVSKESNIQNILTILEEQMNVSLVHFQLSEYFPFEDCADPLNYSSNCSISNRFISHPTSSYCNTSVNNRNRILEFPYEEAVRESEEFGLTSDITFKEVADSKKKKIHDNDQSFNFEPSRGSFIKFFAFFL